MNSSNVLPQARLFRFHVPDLAAELAIPVEQMVGVARMPSVTHIPCMPPAILGMGRWQNMPTVIVDLRLVLDQAMQPTAWQDYAEHHHVILKVVLENRVSLVGSPILPGGQMVSVPLSLPKAELPAGLSTEAIHQAVMVGGDPIMLLNTMRLPALLSSLQPVA